MFGGGTAGGPIDAITQITPSGRSRPAGHLPVADVGHDRGDDRRDRLHRRRLHDDHPAALGARLPSGRPRRARSPPCRTRCATPRPPRSAAACSSPAAPTGPGRATRSSASTPPAIACASSATSRPASRTPPARRSGTPSTSSAAAATRRPASAARIWAIDPATGRVRARRAAADRALGPRRGRGRRPAAGGRRARRAGRRAPRAARASRAVAHVVARTAALDVYAATRPGMLAPQVRGDVARVYVPNSQSNTVDVIDQRTGRIVDHFAVGALPQHVTPSWDLRTLWVTNDNGNSLTPIDPRTGRHGRPVAGRRPLQPLLHRRRTPRDRRRRGPSRARLPRARTPCACVKALHVPTCAGVDHMDYTADGRLALVSCEFAGRMVVVDLRRERVVKDIDLRAGAMPQDVKLSPDGRTFYVADMASNGVWLIDAHRMRKERFEHTGRGAHGLYPSRDSRYLYVSNRGGGTISADLVPHPAARCAPGGSPAAARPTWAASRPTGACSGSPAATTARSTRSPPRTGPPAAPHPRRPRPARSVRLAPARPLLDRAHRDPALDR